jgi:hypothetical protein
MIVVVFIAGCSNCNLFRAKPKKSIPVQTVSKEPLKIKRCELKPFRSVVVGGNAEVELIHGLYGAKMAINSCQNAVFGHTLYIGSGKAKVFAPKLENIIVTDHALVRSKKMKSDGLNVTAKGWGSINLEGRYRINKVTQLGRGRIDISWIDNNDLRVEGYAGGPIFLSGRVEKMIVKLMNDARLYARYLRVREGSVFTTDKALAEVLVLDNLGAYAIDASNIYYYKRPENITVVTRDSGNVLYPERIR